MMYPNATAMTTPRSQPIHEGATLTALGRLDTFLPAEARAPFCVRVPRRPRGASHAHDG